MTTPSPHTRFRRALLVSAGVAAAAALAAAGAFTRDARAASWWSSLSSTCPYGCQPAVGANADDRIREVRDALVAKRAKLGTKRAQVWLDHAVASLDEALAPQRWLTGGYVATTAAGLEGLRDVRLAVGRLAWADPTLHSATLLQRTDLVAVMSDIALGRFNAVWGVADRSDRATRMLLWQAETDIHKGEQDFFVNRVRATIAFIRSWQRLLDQPA
jgi:hypothetical protein